MVQEINRAVAVLKQNGLVAIPTETVYGLAANALSAKAVLKIFEAKNRPHFDPLIIHVASFKDVFKYVNEVHSILEKLMKLFWPGPLTVLLPRKSIIPDITCSGLERAAFRVPNHPLTLELLQHLDFPLAAPSANPFGYVSPTKASHVHQQLGQKIDFILDGGSCKVGIESTIVGEENGKIIIYRLGGLSQEEIETATGEKCFLKIANHSNPQTSGQLDKHYATRKPLKIVDAFSSDSLAITFGKNAEKENPLMVLNLSKSGNLSEAALNLFSMMRQADQNADFDTIETKLVPDINLGRAINDRLKRAAVQS